MNAENWLPNLLAIAWLLPLASYLAIALVGQRARAQRQLAGRIATGSIAAAALVSQFALWGVWAPAHGFAAPGDGRPAACAGDWYTLVAFGQLKITIGYYIDGLTVLMFALVTFIATAVHVYSLGYMRGEMEMVVDHEASLAAGGSLRRPGRFGRFFQYLSLFSFSMLGVVIAGNLAMVFVFWELVGFCSYLLIGFYIERRSAILAANKAFIVNRIGDAGMLIGIMALFGCLGTLDFGDLPAAEGQPARVGLFSAVRPAATEYRLQTPDGMLADAGAAEVASIVREHREPARRDVAGSARETSADAGAGLAAVRSEVASRVDQWRDDWEATPYGRRAYWLLVTAGLGIFFGCVGKSAQFPLHVWLPDAMEGPTPVSALVHSATMVAAGVYLVGRCYPFLAPEVLATIAVVGCATLIIGGTIALVATDIKRVLAWSTVSQLGYMLLALGVGGWIAGLFHLVTHAFFKSLLFLGAGSVIHAAHTNELPLMGGLRHKMPWTASMMLIGCLAIAGAGLPFVVGLSGYYSKDAILAQTLAFRAGNPGWSFLFFAATASAGLTSFYMFRLWCLTFAGEPRDPRSFRHAHEAPRSMIYPQVALAALAIGAGWSLGPVSVESLLEQALPAGCRDTTHGQLAPQLAMPGALAFEPYHSPATLAASLMGLAGFGLATALYGLRLIDPREVQQQFTLLFRFLLHKWYFDELYQGLFVRPTIVLARTVGWLDRRWIDWLIDGLGRGGRAVARWDAAFDRRFVDGAVNRLAHWTFDFALSLRGAQTGQLRQYVLFLIAGAVGVFVVIGFALAG